MAAGFKILNGFNAAVATSMPPAIPIKPGYGPLGAASVLHVCPTGKVGLSFLLPFPFLATAVGSMLAGHGSIPFRGWTAVRVIVPGGAATPPPWHTIRVGGLVSPARQPRLSTAMPSPRPAGCALASA